MQTRRRVEITIGVPESLRAGQEAEGPDPMEDCYCVHFEERAQHRRHEDGEDAEDSHGLTIQAACLCMVAEAAELWLTTGITPEGLEHRMKRGHDHDRKKAKKRRHRKK